MNIMSVGLHQEARGLYPGLAKGLEQSAEERPFLKQMLLGLITYSTLPTGSTVFAPEK